MSNVVIDPLDVSDISGTIQSIQEQVDDLGKEAKITGISVEWKSSAFRETTYTLACAKGVWSLMVSQP